MNHVEEGTIHAWLDGALDAAQSAEVDAHVKACAECSAKVAEARGLIAASSRILVSLDDVPANVIPKKAPVAPVRRWRAAPWVSGLAAAAVILVLWRTGGVEQPKVASDIVIPSINVVPSVPEPSLERLKEMPAPPPPTERVAADRRQSKVGNSPQVTIGRASGAGAAAGGASDLAAAGASAPALTAATKDEALEVVGCYRIADVPKLQLESVVAGVAEARAPEKAARARGAVASAPAPAAMQKSADADVSLGTLVRLDEQGFVRAIGSDSIMGSWDHYKADSARVRFGSRAPYVSNLNKVRCP